VYREETSFTVAHCTAAFSAKTKANVAFLRVWEACGDKTDSILDPLEPPETCFHHFFAKRQSYEMNIVWRPLIC
jgi:hypothetical protein